MGLPVVFQRTAYVAVALACVSAGGVTAAAQEPARIDRLNHAFLEHTAALGPQHARAAEVIERSFREDYGEQPADGFVPDALAVLYPAFRQVLDAFDDERFEDVSRLLEPLRGHADPYLAATVDYYYARALIERGLLEQAELVLQLATQAERRPEDFTPYAAHLWYLRGFCEASDLRFDEALESLRRLGERFPDAPEVVRVAGRQLLLEIERRERGTLDEVAGLMAYAAARLKLFALPQRVRERQDAAVALLDKLIKAAEERERKACQGHGQARSGRRPGGPGAQESRAPEQSAGPGRVGAQHAAPPANPGEMWGKLPPAERERILQALRDRFPSRYRQLVEQYYRALAEEK